MTSRRVGGHKHLVDEFDDELKEFQLKCNLCLAPACRPNTRCVAAFISEGVVPQVFRLHGFGMCSPEVAISSILTFE